MSFRFLSSSLFWLWSLLTAATSTAFFAWELGYFSHILPTPTRPPVTQSELVFTAILITLLALNVGLLVWQTKNGSCPIGAKRATTTAGALGVVTLLCPACLLLPISLFGTSLSLVFLTPFLPLLRIIAILILAVTAGILWPRKS